MDHVAGLSLFNDATLRDFQKHSTQFTAGKNFVGTGGFGPWITTLDEIPDFGPIELRTTVNGETRQVGRLADLTFPIPELIAYVSTFMRLAPGDVIATGTPSGVGHGMNPPKYLRAGDVVHVSADRLGVLENAIAREPLDGSAPG
ncbi:MAG: fumarylacetoacetate hydrolase family protein [Myxococcales bacterium]|nr:fumarylacetoacetate hydrolase family protein [Myxococcales bacterium]